MPYDISYLKKVLLFPRVEYYLENIPHFLVLLLYLRVNDAKFFKWVYQNLYFQMSILESSIYSSDVTIVGAICSLCLDIDLKVCF